MLLREPELSFDESREDCELFKSFLLRCRDPLRPLNRCSGVKDLLSGVKDLCLRIDPIESPSLYFLSGVSDRCFLTVPWDNLSSEAKEAINEFVDL